MPYTVKKTFEQVAAAGAHVIAQVKANQPTLHQRVAELCQRTAPLDQTRTADQKQRSRDEIRVVEVFAPGTSLADQGSRMKVCDPMLGANFEEAVAPGSC